MREISLNAAALRLDMAWHTLERMAVEDRTVAHRVRFVRQRRRIYIPVAEVARLRGRFFPRIRGGSEQ
jgi:hypothetical protein